MSFLMIENGTGLSPLLGYEAIFPYMALDIQQRKAVLGQRRESVRGTCN